MDWQAFWLTFRLAVIVTAVLLALGLPIAYWIAFSRWRWKFLCEAVVALPIVLPPTVLGFYVLIALGTHSPLGRWWQSMTGHTLAFTFEGLVIGSVLYSLPFAVQPFAASFSAVDRRLLNASAVLGVSKFRTFWRVIVPLSLSGLVTGIVLFGDRNMPAGTSFNLSGGGSQTFGGAIYLPKGALQFTKIGGASISREAMREIHDIIHSPCQSN